MWEFTKKPQISKFSSLSAFSEDTSSEILFAELSRMKKKLLLRSCKNVTRFTIGNPLTQKLSEEQLRTIASLLPDIAIASFDYKLQTFQGSILFADISGFTDLSDKYQKLENGASKLSSVLNTYLGSMVQEILSHDGDIIKFAGDAFIAVFKAENDFSIQDAIHRAMDTSLIIQNKCRNYLTEIGVILNVKISITCGDLYFSVIGEAHCSNYIIFGDPVWEAKALENKVTSGEILLTSKAMFFAKESLYIHQYNRQFRYFKLLGFKDGYEFSQGRQEAVLSIFEPELEKTISETSTIIQEISNELSILSFPLERAKDSYALRRSLNLTLNNRSPNFLRRFIIKPLMNAIDLNEGIDNLSEMRHIVIVFSNFVVPYKTPNEFVVIVDNIFKKLSEIVINYEGIVNKVILFDKDMMFLVIFGLRGLKHEVEARIGLSCASEFHKTFKSWPEIKSVSISVTSGMTYCGVVGHALRREYTVISLTVNKAARLMIAYPAIISCDQETVLLSRMPLHNFKILEKKYMKGLDSNIIAYQFNEVFDDAENGHIPVKYNFPLLGRDELLELAANLLRLAISLHNQRNVTDLDILHNCLIIEGDPQQGKTRVLEEIFTKCHEDNLNCLRIKTSVKESKISYQIIYKIMMDAFKSSQDVDESNVENFIKEKLINYEVNDSLSLLNDVFGTNFLISESLNLLDEVEIDKARREIFKVLCVQTFKEFSVIFIDSVDFIDVESFALIECLLTIKSIFVFATMGHQKRLSGEQRKFLCETNIMHYRLKPLDTAIQNQLACLYFQVSALSFELENYFRKNSNGNPGWIEKCSKSLVQNNQIHIESMTLAEVHQKGFFYYEEHAKLKSSHEKDSIQFERNFLDKCYSNRMENENLKNSIVKVAMLLESLLSPNEFSLSTKYENDLMIFDSLLPYEQVVCKCAAAIGTQFKREILHYVLSSSTSRMIGKSITKLFELHIFSCASSFIDCHTNIIDENESIKRINCNCDNTTIFRSCRDLPNYASCKALIFQREDFQNVVYQSLTEKQRMDFHKKSLIFLHLETKRCSACGSGKFSELQIENFDFQFHDGVQLIDDTSIDRMMNYFNSIQIPVTNLNINKSIFRNFPKFHKNEVKVRPILLNFLEYDFRSCNCNQILYSTYNNLLRHCHSNDTKLKLIEFKIRLASLCIDSCNVPHAKILLVEATNLIKIYQQGKDSLYEVYLNSKATMLQGKCALKMMQPDKGIENFIAACKLLKISFPLSFGLKEKIKLKILIRNIKKYLNVTEPQNCSALMELITIQSSEILKCIFEFLFERKQYDLAKLAAFWSLEKILKLKKYFAGVIESFNNVIKITIIIDGPGKFQWLKGASLSQMVKRTFTDEIYLRELKTICKLYQTIMMSEIARNELRLAMEVGKIALNICLRSQSPCLQNKIVPPLYLIMMSLKRFDEALLLLEEFLRNVKMLNDKNGLTWYHALCLDMLLDTGFTIITYDSCNEFYINEMTSIDKIASTESRARFFGNLLLYSVRQKAFEKAQTWMGKLQLCFFLEPYGFFNDSFTSLRIMESFTLCLVHAKEHNLTKISYYETELLSMAASMKNAFRKCWCFKERFKLQKVYFGLTSENSARNLDKLENILKLALNNKNFLSYDIIKHNQRFWTFNLPPKLQSFWIDNSTSEKALYLSNYPHNSNIFPFSLSISESGKSA